MERMKFESPDLTVQNIDKIAALFPNCITEMLDEEHSTQEKKVYKRAVNFEMLKQMLSPEVVDGDECYEFTWVGKKASIVEANKPIRKTLRPCPEESKNWDTTENLYIEGDNLEVLKLLQESYLGKVKMIYIDPPYNTGNDFIYADDFMRSQQEENEQMGMFDEEENRLFKNNDTNGRFHSDWCSMMYSRLMLARNLLTDDGAIFISIDDVESSNLRKICGEVFGESCFVGDVVYQRTYAPRNDSKGICKEAEHLFVFSKTSTWQPKKLPRTAEMNEKYKSPDGDPVLWRPDNPCGPGASTHQGMVYAIQNPFTGEMQYPSNSAHWRYGQNDMLQIMSGWGDYRLEDIHDEEKRAEVCGVNASAVRKGVMGIVLNTSLEQSRDYAKQVLEKGCWPVYYFTKNGDGGLAKKTYLNNDNGKVVTNLWLSSDVGHTDEAKKELLSLFDGKAPFDTPKPTRLIKRILDIASEKDSIIMDFFSGSATTAQAVMSKNAEDNGCRKFIMVQVPEKSPSSEYETLCEIGKERIRRAGEEEYMNICATAGSSMRWDREKRKTDPNYPCPDNVDIGFRVLKLDDTNMKDVYYAPDDYDQNLLSMLESNIKDDRTDLDLLFGCLLDWGLPLSLPYKSEQLGGCTVHTYNDGDLIACFDSNIPESVVQEIAKRKPLRAVFRDSGFASSPEKINVFEIFKLYMPEDASDIGKRVKVI